MVRRVKVQEAKTHLSAILVEVEHGNEVVIARGETPIARLLPIAEVPDREWGFVPYDVPVTFFDDLPAAEVAAWGQ